MISFSMLSRAADSAFWFCARDAKLAESFVVGALGCGRVPLELVEGVPGRTEGTQKASVRIGSGAGFGEDLFKG
jgi:hypothetical protein